MSRGFGWGPVDFSTIFLVRHPPRAESPIHARPQFIGPDRLSGSFWKGRPLVMAAPSRIRLWADAVLRRLLSLAKRAGLGDRWLLAALVLGVALGAQGIGWGRYDCLNADAMAFRSLFAKDRPPMHPGEFLKPPFYTYVNHFVARLPATALSAPFFFAGKPVQSDAYFRIRLILGRLLNLAIFAGLVTMVFWTARRYLGAPSARLAAALLATSAGLVPFQIYLTTDLALLFMMMASFVFACRIVRTPTMGISVAAGLLAGLAAATKYNGLAVAAALPIAHLLAGSGNRILAAWRRPAAWACGAAVPAGFLIGNPYAVLDWPKFSSDFFYNYTTTPVYSGQTTGHGYAAFFQAYPEIFGWPALAILLAGLLASVLVLASRDQRRLDGAWALWLLAVAVVALYTWQIGSFPRMKTRFVLPMAPFILLLAAIGFPILLRFRRSVLALLAVTIAYNVVCGWWIGELFRNDPRMVMLPLIEERITGSPNVEISKSIPPIALIPGRKIRAVRMPAGIGRAEIFDGIFAENEEMQKLKGRWKPRAGAEWFTSESRAKRNPDWIIWCTKDLEKVVAADYEALFDPSSGYAVAFDATSPALPWWAYPQEPDFLINRTTIWERTGRTN